MDITSKLDMFLMTEAAVVKMTPYGKSYVKLQTIFSQEELDTILSKMESNAQDKMKYEVSFGKTKDKDKLIIYRKGLIKKSMSPEDTKAFRQEMTGVLKGTGLKIVGDTKSADWAAVYATK